MDYDEVANEYEKGVDWQNWPQTNDRDVLEMRLAALRHKEAKCSQEAQKLHRESDRLAQLLMTM
ncbi:MAG: hypothetical protein LBK67_09310 [Coriobacteriales bacterium]|jgi:hypothetical protein|nr:hypothetical protein [Coriobacteriales bacterium]